MMLRRTLLAASPGLAIAGSARAQPGFPTHPVRLIVPFAAGASLDAVSRTLGRALEARWGQPVVVENRTGAGGNIGAQVVATAAPDGHTLLAGTSGLITVNPHLYQNLGFDIPRDLAPVAMLGSLPNVMVVPASSPARSVAEFIAAARAAGRPMLYGSPGSGSYIHVTGALFARETGLPAEHVAYRGSAPALTDLAAGRLDVMFENQPGALPFIRDGRLRALAVTTPERSAALPEVPTTTEAGLPGVIAVPWFAVFASGQTPLALRARIAADIAAVQETSEPRRVLDTLGIRSETLGPEPLAAMIARERERMGAVVRGANIRAE